MHKILLLRRRVLVVHLTLPLKFAGFGFVFNECTSPFRDAAATEKEERNHEEYEKTGIPIVLLKSWKVSWQPFQVNTVHSKTQFLPSGSSLSNKHNRQVNQ
ncbi:uncharacterized protein LOC144316961 [Canis aureus]